MYPHNPYYPQMGQPQGYQRPSYIPQQQMYQQPMNPPMMQDGMVQARFVASREEAIAATVIPGSMFLFYDRANRKIYSKLIDPQTGMPDFREFGENQPEQQQIPQYATLEAVSTALQELEQRVDQKINALTAPKQATRKAVTSNDE